MGNFTSFTRTANPSTAASFSWKSKRVIPRRHDVLCYAWEVNVVGMTVMSTAARTSREDDADRSEGRGQTRWKTGRQQGSQETEVGGSCIRFGLFPPSKG